jgi:hypothetical protein
MDLTRLLVVAVAAAGIAILFRALPWPKSWLRRKPWVCAACAGGHGAWVALVIQGEWYGWRLTALFYFCVTAVAAWVFHQVFPPAVDFGP